jgi:peptide deformylase
MVPIVQEPDPVLRSVAAPVKPEDIQSAKIQKVIADMISALESQADGVAIAAPQIGVSLRIFVVGGAAFARGKKSTNGEKLPYHVFINPEFSHLSKSKKWMDGEGCLSVRWQYGQTERHIRVTLTALNELGEAVTVEARGLVAHIFQHEMDHLNGVLFIDHARNLHEAHPEVIEE